MQRDHGLARTWPALDNEHARLRRANDLVLLALVGMNGVVLCADLFSIYIFIEIATVSSFILIASDKSRAGFEGAFKYFVLSATASIAILTGREIWRVV